MAEFELGSSQLLQLLNPLYRVWKFGHLYNEKINNFNRNDLDMNTFKYEPDFYKQVDSGSLEGLRTRKRPYKRSRHVIC